MENSVFPWLLQYLLQSRPLEEYDYLGEMAQAVHKYLQMGQIRVVMFEHCQQLSDTPACQYVSWTGSQ